MSDQETRIEKLERLVADKSPLDVVVGQSELIIKNHLQKDEAPRLQEAIATYGGILSSVCPIIVWVNPSSVLHVSTD